MILYGQHEYVYSQTSSAQKLGKNHLESSVFYRFGRVNAGLQNSWYSYKESNLGLFIRYGISKYLTLQIGFDKYTNNESYLQIHWLTKNHWHIASKHIIEHTFDQSLASIYNEYYTSRFNFGHQIQVEKEFSDQFTIQLAPTLLHFNLVEDINIPHDQFYLGIIFKYSVTEKSFLVTEFFLPIQHYENHEANSLNLSYSFPFYQGSLQFSLTNNQSSFLIKNISQSMQPWNKGFVHIGIRYTYLFI